MSQDSLRKYTAGGNIIRNKYICIKQHNNSKKFSKKNTKNKNLLKRIYININLYEIF